MQSESDELSAQTTATERLNVCSDIFLVRYEEAPEILDLRVLVHEGRAEPDSSPLKSGNKDVDRIFTNARPITVRPGYGAFSITFREYVAFAIRDESYSLPEENEEFNKRLRSYRTSHFLDFVSSSMSVGDYDSRPLRHYGVCCNDHIIDVVCFDDPEVTYAPIQPDDLIE